MTEDNNSDIDGTEDGELMRLLEQTTLSLQERTASTSMISHCLMEDFERLTALLTPSGCDHL